MPAAAALAALLAATSGSLGPPTAERWGIWEANLTLPTASFANPFLDVELQATFELVAPGDGGSAAPLVGAAAAPAPLVALDAASGGAAGVTNSGTSKATAPDAQVLSVERSTDVPAGATGRSLDFGTDVTARHVVELPGDRKPFEGGLAGLKAFTISGWVQVHDGAEGDGGNRIVNFCAGGPGIDLVWVGQAGGQLKLAVNEWPDGTHPTSSGGTVPVASSSPEWPFWRFFAVTYDSEAAPGESSVAWYFGNSRDAAKLDSGATHGQSYNKGAVGDPHLPLAFGNFGSGFKKNDRLLRGALYDPAIFGRALSPSEIVAVQHRSGCAPSCGKNACGSDGCGGSCGACSSSHVCGNRGGGPHRCQSRSTLTVGGFYDGGDDFKLRFSPPFTGRWSFTTHSNIPALSNHKGEISVGPAPAGQHGPVESQRTRFAHADGTPYFSVGSTSYQVRATHHS